MSKTYDLAICFDEIELIELRLHTLKHVVDTFVFAEATESHSGTKKPLHVSEALKAGRFDGFDVRVHVVEHQPAPTPGGFPYGGRHPREYALRNSLAEAIRPYAHPDDLVLISDVDEIPDPALVRARHMGVHVQSLYVYYLNGYFPHEWCGTVSVPYHTLYYQTPHGLRASNAQMPRARGGWHFSYQGGVERNIALKLRNATDAEDVRDEHYTQMQERAERLEDPRGRLPPAGLPKGWFVPVDETFPPLLQEHPERFPGWIKEVT